jgi:hypothetical protein
VREIPCCAAQHVSFKLLIQRNIIPKMPNRVGRKIAPNSLYFPVFAKMLRRKAADFAPSPKPVFPPRVFAVTSAPDKQCNLTDNARK